MRVLFTEQSLAQRRGTQLFTRDAALGLLRRGHTPVVHSTQLGELAAELRDRTLPVVDDLDALASAPDVIHGHWHVDTLAAVLRFRGVPAVAFCHSWLEEGLGFPVLPSITRYVAVDSACRDRLVHGWGAPEDRVRTLLNFVDLERFGRRGPLPARPARALLFGSYAPDAAAVLAVREACARAALPLDSVGEGIGGPTARPEALLPRYDLVFARGRSAIEALAVGAAVIPVVKGIGPLVTTANLERLRPLNFGIRAADGPPTAECVLAQIRAYEAADAAEVSRRMRAEAGVESALDELLAIYGEAIDEYRRKPPDPEADMRAAARHLRAISQRLHADARIRAERNALRRELDALRAGGAGRRALRAAWRRLRRLGGGR
jgi:hypothetical protein